MSYQREERLVSEVWAAYWKDRQVEPWDSLSEIIVACLLEEPVQGRTILEAGCGTGRISRRLAREGARVICLDNTQEALDLARRNFGDVPGTFVQGSIFDLPELPPCDLVWSSGVLEHFHPEEQRRAIAQFLTCAPRVILINPYSGAPLYRVAKALLELGGKWPYGREIPVWTMAGCLPVNAILEKEYKIAILPFFLDAYKFAPMLAPACSFFQRLLFKTLGTAKVARLDRVLSRILGGYLLVSVIAKQP